MKRLTCYIFILINLISEQVITAQEQIRIVSYNLENLFDCENDSLTNDESFTPTGAHEWTKEKYRTKLNNLSKAIAAAGEWEYPAIIGLCEVENKKVVEDLLNETQLKICGYKSIHKDSPDKRGVDVALAYRQEDFNVFDYDFIRVHLENERPTRDILKASGVLANGDTLHVFVNHWPSRYGGELESEPKRMAAAETLREEVNKLFTQNSQSNIVIMGDFNDYPHDESIINGLCVQYKTDSLREEQLYNLSAQYDEKGETGSHKFGGKWGMLDQIIVSNGLLNQTTSTHTHQNLMHICTADFLLKEDQTGFAPKRAFLGTFFANGYSDHLPVYVDLIFQNIK